MSNKAPLLAVVCAALFLGGTGPPSLKGRDLVITAPEFGAAGDGKTLCTAAIQKAVDACFSRGGGRVVMPRGRFRTGTVFLKDRIELHLRRGSTLMGSGDYRDFPLLHPEYPSLHDRNGYAALIYAEKAAGIAITGRGTIDGHNAAWTFHPGLEGGSDEDGRPRNILLVSCSGIRVEGITLLNPVMWNQHYLNCEDVVVDGGVCENIKLSDITIEGTQSAVFIRLGRRNRPYRKDIPVVRDSIMRGLTLPRIIVRGTGDVGCFVLGLPGNPIRDLTLVDIAVESLGGIVSEDVPSEVEEKPGAYPQPTSWGVSRAYGFFIRHAENVTIRNMKLMTRMPEARSPFYLIDVKTVYMTGLSAVRYDAGVPFIVKQDVTDGTIVEPENWKLRIF